MNRRSPRILLGLGVLSTGLLLVLLGSGAYPLLSLRGEPARGSLSRFHRRLAKHVAAAADSELGIAPNPQTAADNSVQNTAVPGAALLRRALRSTGSSSGLVINASFDSSITNNPNAQAIEAAI